MTKLDKLVEAANSLPENFCVIKLAILRRLYDGNLDALKQYLYGLIDMAIHTQAEATVFEPLLTMVKLLR